MPLNRIVPLAVLILVVLQGCSARRFFRSDPSDDDVRASDASDLRHENPPALRDHRYESPEIEQRPREPVPAPPAFGVSRIKSVSWLNWNREPAQTHTPDEACVDTLSDTASGCTRSEAGCTPSAEGCGSNVCVDRYLEHRESNRMSARHSTVVRIRKLVPRLFQRPVTSPDSCCEVSVRSCTSETPPVGAFTSIDPSGIANARQQKSSPTERRQEDSDATKSTKEPSQDNTLYRTRSPHYQLAGPIEDPVDPYGVNEETQSTEWNCDDVENPELPMRGPSHRARLPIWPPMETPPVQGRVGTEPPLWPRLWNSVPSSTETSQISLPEIIPAR